MPDTLLSFHDAPEVTAFLEGHPELRALFAGLTPECAHVVHAAILAGQEHIFEGGAPEEVRALIEELLSLEDYFAPLGGILGYQRKIEEILLGEKEECTFSPPEGIDLDSCNTLELGIQGLPEMGEIYPVGGAADRLAHTDDAGNPLPAAPLTFMGRSLLEGMVRDTEAREHLYKTRYGKAIETPIALMTSDEKENHTVIEALLRERNFFGRSPDSFFLFKQPSVPTVDWAGKWILDAPCQLVCKPGGHGALWRLAAKSGAFDWFRKKGRKKLLVRQINNPIAGTDHGLITFMGLGHQSGKSFGFLSCPQRPGASEGVNVCKTKAGLQTISNVEYCDISQLGLEERAVYPANTNILFADIDAIETAVETLPFPGLLLNFKEGSARLETTMQNIADAFFATPEAMETFIAFGERRKTISAVKREPGSGHESAEGCFADIQANARELLTQCGVTLPEEPITFTYHPALGPLYTIIKEKLRGGRLTAGSALSIENPNVSLQNVAIDGALTIEGAGAVVLCNVAIEGECTLVVEEGAEFVARGKSLSGIISIKKPPTQVPEA